MPIIYSVLSWFMMQRNHQIETFMRYPSEVQEDLLKKYYAPKKYEPIINSIIAADKNLEKTIKKFVEIIR